MRLSALTSDIGKYSLIIDLKILVESFSKIQNNGGYSNLT